MGNFLSFIQSYNLEEIDRKLGENFGHPLAVAYGSNWMLKAIAIKGEFSWQAPPEDMLFLIHKGEILLETESSMLSLKEGEGGVIPKNTKYKQRAAERAVILYLEPADKPS